MRSLTAIAGSGLGSLRRRPARAFVMVACVVAAILPFVAGLGVSRGLRDRAEESLRLGGDLVVTGRRLGRDVPFDEAAADAVRALPGVVRVVPRIVADVRLGGDAHPAVLVGIPPDGLPTTTDLVEGRLFDPAARGELVVGSRLAARLSLRVGARIPPFHRNDRGERISTVVGVFRGGLPVWEANVLLTSLGTARGILGGERFVTDLVVTCAPGETDRVRRAVLGLASLGPADAEGPVLPRAVAREDLRALVERGLLDREGLFDLHLLLVFAIGLPLLLVASGVGLSERRREAALLAATGWRTDEILLRGLAEHLAIAVLGASAAILLAWVWLGRLGGAGIAPVFLSGLEAGGAVDVPWRLTPVPALLGLAIATVLVLTGGLLALWRAATAPPAEALR